MGANGLPITVGEILAAWRARRGWTLREAGKRLGVSFSHVSDVERGRRAPSFAFMLRAERVYGIGAQVLAHAWADEQLRLARLR